MVRVLILVLLFFGFSAQGVISYYTNMSATVVVGQQDFTSSSVNQGGSIGRNTLRSPYQMIMIGSKFVVVDENNHRILIYNSIPSSNNASADVVIGQQDFTAGSANQGNANPTSSTLNLPTDISTDGTKLFIADYLNNRVLIYNQLPTTNNASADVVIGQSAMTTKTSGITASTMLAPSSVFFDSSTGKLFISEDGNNRVLIYNQVPTSNGASADLVLGQANFTSGSANRGGARGANTLKEPYGVKVFNGKLLVADPGNHRILIWNSIPTSNGASADLVLGQANFTSGSANQGGSPRANTLNGPYCYPIIENNRLFVIDLSNNRLLIYNSIPTSNNASADLVIGQANFTGNSVNQGGSVAGNTLNDPVGLLIADNKLLIADRSNNRILIFPNTLSTPQLGISSIDTLADSRLRIKGTVEVGERGRYSLSSVQASVNGEGYGNVSEMSGGRDNGVGNTLYDFTHEFSPWQNNGTKETWSSRGWLAKVKAITSNAEESTAVLFSPFNFTSISGDSSKPTFKFTVPVHHWSTLVDSLDSYEVQIKRSNESEYTTYISSIPVSTSVNPLLNTTHDSSLGTITVSSKTKPLTPGSYTVRIVAKSKSGYSFSSNTISYTSDTKPATFIPSVSSFHLSLTSISNLNPQLSSYLKPSKVDFYSKLSSVSTTFKGIAYANSTITLTLIQQNCNPTPNKTNTNTTSSSSSCTHTYTTTTQPNSTFSILVPNKDLLSNKKYTGFLTATLNKQEASVAPFTFSVN